MTNLINVQDLKEVFVKDMTNNIPHVIETLQPELDAYLAVGFKWLEDRVDQNGCVTKEMMSSQENRDYTLSLPEVKALEDKLSSLYAGLKENGIPEEQIRDRVTIGTDEVTQRMGIPLGVRDNFINKCVKELQEFVHDGHISVEDWTAYMMGSIANDPELRECIESYYSNLTLEGKTA